ncbi:helix-turn-helix domain-containing protein [Metabacillus idriensis]|uniref:helix-turn-helix domain-containing protein n=1 Tax=Metabacillus idriensis TaxID=324768 RepID=UPI002041BB81|nr:helix-turn-helix domain-containing protein [Metabacillus idriensis]MCM3594177.1 helix-turn-helix domain-containing protein [Metabacillus idriensis]
MLQINIDEVKVEELYREELKRYLDKLEMDTTFWDMKDLVRHTRMSKSTILYKFFYHKDFPKYRPGRDWIFPADDTKEFLLKWLREQPRS